MNDDRRSTRRVPAVASIEVTDSITDERIGRVGNLSRAGVMLICQRPFRDDAIYQLQLRASERGETIEIGVHTMWTQAAATDNRQWSGHRIISIAPDAVQILDRWIRLDRS